MKLSDRILTALLLLAGTPTAVAWLSTSRFPAVSQRLSPLQEASEGGVDTIRLDGLGDDHEQVGADLGASVQRWLDAEWMPQEIHAQIGESCAASYVICRRDKNTDDIMTIMTQVADDLTKVWFEKYDADAFVNAWDVSNYVSDYLTNVSGNEGCECSTPVH